MKILKAEKIQEVGYVVLSVAAILLSIYGLATGNHFLGKLAMVLMRVFFHLHTPLE
jgi:hypothetical protein